MNRALIALAVVCTLSCTPALNEKHVWVAPTRGLMGGAGALVDGPIAESAKAFAARNGLVVTVCPDSCDLAAVRAGGAGSLLSASADDTGIEVTLSDANGSGVGSERMSDAAAVAAVVDRLLYARFGGVRAAPVAPRVVVPVEEPPLIEPVIEPAFEDEVIEEREAERVVGAYVVEGERAKARPKGGKPRAGRELMRGEADGGLLVLTTDALSWKPTGMNLEGRRAKRFPLDDVKRIFVENGKLNIRVSWGPKYTYDTKTEEMRWRNAIDDARSAWTGKPRDKM